MLNGDTVTAIFEFNNNFKHFYRELELKNACFGTTILSRIVKGQVECFFYRQAIIILNILFP